MNIRNIDVYSYRLTCRPPLIVGGNELTERKGWIIEINTEGGSGFGEVSPLPFFSRETSAEVEEQLKKIRNNWPGKKKLPEMGNELSALGSLPDIDFLAPSARCGLEAAILEIIAGRGREHFAALFGGRGRSFVNVNALIPLNDPDPAATAGNLADAGYRYIKLKVDADIDACVEKVKGINRRLDGKAELHLDANRTWNIDQAIRFGKAVGGAVRYIEEPFADLSGIPSFYRETGIPVALDESLAVFPLDDIPRPDEGVRVLILKPALHGGFLKILDMIRKAKGLGMRTVISSCFESDIGISFLARFASCQEDHVFSGLDTLGYFRERLLKESVKIENGRCAIVHGLVNRSNIDFGLLERLP